VRPAAPVARSRTPGRTINLQRKRLYHARQVSRSALCAAAWLLRARLISRLLVNHSPYEQPGRRQGTDPGEPPASLNAATHHAYADRPSSRLGHSWSRAGSPSTPGPAPMPVIVKPHGTYTREDALDRDPGSVRSRGYRKGWAGTGDSQCEATANPVPTSWCCGGKHSGHVSEIVTNVITFQNSTVMDWRFVPRAPGRWPPVSPRAGRAPGPCSPRRW
jgi:hypothetical protein